MTKNKKAAKPLTRQEPQYSSTTASMATRRRHTARRGRIPRGPADAASKLMKRTDVQKHIANVLDKIQEKAAERSAEALTLKLEKAESRLAELIEQRRHNCGEMLTQMTGKCTTRASPSRR